MSAVHPYSFQEAKAAIEKASLRQLDAERQLREAHSASAEAERSYRKALAETMLRLRADGKPASVLADLARGDDKVADLRYRRDVALGIRDAAAQAAFRHAADRRELEQLIDWSRRVAPDGQFTPEAVGLRGVA